VGLNIATGEQPHEKGLTFLVAHQLLNLFHPDWYVELVLLLHPDKIRLEALPEIPSFEWSCLIPSKRLVVTAVSTAMGVPC